MSNYNLVSSEVYISRLDDMYNIKSTDIIPRIPQYVAQAMQLIDYPFILQETQKDIEVVDFKALLPCHIEYLQAVKYNGKRLEETTVVNEKEASDLSNQDFLYGGYQILSDRWISLRFEEGTITVYYKTLPVEQGSDGTLFPLVLDDEKIHECIDSYILKMLLMRGYVHPLLSLDSKNVFINPALLFEVKLKQARNAMYKNTEDERFQMSKILRDFITDPDAYRTVHFNNTGI